MTRLFESFGEMAQLSPAIERAFLDIVVKKTFKKKELLQREGTVCNEIYFIEKGIARTFYYQGNKDITYWIASENEFVGSMASFFSRTPGNKYVETLEESILWVFDYFKLEELYSRSKEMERMGRLFASYGISILEKRFDDFHFLTARERYLLLIKRHPKLLQRVPLGVIASYLGVTPETVSRIRSRR